MIASVTKRVIELGLELGIEDLPVRKNKLIELFSQLILNDMSILGDSTKSAERYVWYNYS
jgi:hypothetical protein